MSEVNYESDYDRLVGRARGRVPATKTISHHVVPRYAGGTDDETNLVPLTPREHVMAHYLLVKTSTGERRYKALCALRFFVLAYEARFGLTEKERKTFHAAYVTKYVDEALEENHLRNVGRKMNDAFRDKLRSIQSNRSVEWRRHISESKMGDKNPMYGKVTWMKGKRHDRSSIEKQTASLRETNATSKTKERRSSAARNRTYSWVSPTGETAKYKKADAPSGWTRVRPNGNPWP